MSAPANSIRHPMRLRGHWFLSLLVALAGVWSYSTRWLAPNPEVGPFELAASCLYLLALFWLICVGVLRLVIQPRVPRLRGHQLLGLSIATLLGGCGLASAIPIPPPPSASAFHRLTITATGEQNAASQSSEVWVLTWPATMAIKALTPNGWEVRDGSYMSYQNQPTSIVLEGWVAKGDVVELLTHDWSGIAHMQWDSGPMDVVDLYSSAAQRYTVAVPTTAQVNTDWQSVLTWGSDGLLLGVFGLAILVVVLRRSPKNIRRAYLPISVRIILYGTPALLVWSIYLASFWPGLLSSDSLDQWNQTLTGAYNDWHPVFHTLFIWFFSQFGHTTASVAGAQILLLAFVMGWTLVELEELGVPGWILWVDALFMAIAPTNGIMTITLWKDVPFGIATLALTALVIRLVRTRGAALNRWPIVLALGVTAALVALFRHNGPPAAFGSLFILGVAYRDHWRRAAISLAVSVLLWLGVRGPLYQVIHVSGNSQPGLLWPVLHQIAAHLTAGTSLTDDEEVLIGRVIPTDPPWSYACTIVDAIAFNPKLDREFATDHIAELAALAASLAERNPLVTANHLLCNSMFVTRITAPGAPNHFYEISALYDSSGLPVTMSAERSMTTFQQVSIETLSPPLTEWLYPKVRSTLAPGWHWLFWRPALFIYLSLAAALVASLRRHDARVYLVFAPAAITAALLIPLTVGQAFRLVYPVYLVAVTTIPLGWIAADEPESSSGDRSAPPR